MPRTKYSRKSKQANDTSVARSMMIKSFERLTDLRISNLERDALADIKGFEASIEVMISSLPPEIQIMMLGDILLCCQNGKQNENGLMKPPAVPKLKVISKSGKRLRTTSDDGYATEGGNSIGSTSRLAKTDLRVSPIGKTRSSTRKTRLIEQTVSKLKPQHSDEFPLKMDCFKTPALLKSSVDMYDVVTPKIKPNTPLNVLRRPRQGEMVLSMQGSPLLVSAVVEERTANINVPLANGNVMSLLPQEGLRMSHIPALDSETMHQLETLKNHIEKVISKK